MKKFIILLFVMFISLPCFATNWVEYAYKSYIDIDSIEYKGLYKRAWFKILNDGNMQPLKGQKIWYQMQYVYANCSTDEIATQDVTSYSLNKQVLDNYSVPYNFLNFFHTPPETVGRNKHDILCNPYNI